MHPMTMREQLGTIGVEFLELMRTGEDIRLPTDPPDLRGYVELALKGGFPEAILEGEPARRDAWLDGYLSHMLNRDPSTLGVSPDSARLGRFFGAYALNTAGLATDATLNSAAAINHRTGTAYTQLLSDLGVIAELPPWHSNRLARLVAIEIKPTSAPDASDARHLMWLRDELGPQFAAGAILHVGRRKYHLSEQIEAIPICALWA